ncbi:hypothetical protein DMN91_003943 [Ooceraea biroi]|uniref:Uncharacterized protein n=1 Tax=Ooceraea biroi TaxID=2015173 RepID=A0A026X2W9_OOCBI|nr:uncharacterized protein LOC105283007 [Ooceraea biroi]EZA61739.1 hypothetical protein X777_09360 [Ooceraea biroi]RLU23737.1 hypothetical protein DMN91_003943 [Ooceraea biroi]
MSSDKDAEVCIKIRDTLVSITDVISKIEKELDSIDELVKENGQLHTAVDTANKTLAGKARKMGLNVAEIISEGRSADRLELDLVSSITSAAITEKLLHHMDG